jgi:hypothetical protein
VKAGPVQPRPTDPVDESVLAHSYNRLPVARAALALVALVPVIVLAATAGAGVPVRPLQTAFLDAETFTGPQADLAFSRAEAAGATAVRVPAPWAAIAPDPRPPGFSPSDPNDAAYRWSALDTELRLAVARGLEPFVSVEGAPSWGRRRFEGFLRPDPAAYAAFALAAARRYDGATAGLPRVRVWQAWNEPNKVAGPAQIASQPDWYRALVNAFAAAVHSVHRDNDVLAGGVSPFGFRQAVAPLAFMRSLLCMSAGDRPRPTCRARVNFEIWSTHPYTAGGPNHHAYRPNDVSIGDLPEMDSLLLAAARAGHIISHRPLRFWVTEFGWDTKPPDPQGVPAALEARWVAEALYRMWNAGVSLVTWFLLRDDPFPASPYQSGLYLRGRTLAADRPKLALAAFRFPFVALPEGGHLVVWGRTPGGRPGRVVVEQRVGTAWKERTTFLANRYGIFSAAIAAAGPGALRARLADGSATSVAFAPTTTPDHTYQPFGSP